jgi:hypothetical protein
VRHDRRAVRDSHLGRAGERPEGREPVWRDRGARSRCQKELTDEMDYYLVVDDEQLSDWTPRALDHGAAKKSN